MSGGGIREHRANIRQVLAAPEKLAVNDESGYAENACRVGLVANLVVLGAPSPGQVALKDGGVGAGGRQGYFDDFRIFDIELAPPEFSQTRDRDSCEKLRRARASPKHSNRGQ